MEEEEQEEDEDYEDQGKVENGYRGGGKSNNNGSRGQQLVHGCILIIPQAARTSFNLVVSLFLFSSLLLEPRCTTEMRRNKNRRRTGGTAHRFSPLNRVRWLQHRFAQTPDRFSLRSSLLRFLSLPCFLLVFSYFNSLLHESV